MTYLENEGSVSEHNEGRGGHCLPSQIKGASLSDRFAMIVVSIHDRSEIKYAAQAYLIRPRDLSTSNNLQETHWPKTVNTNTKLVDLKYTRN